MEQWNSQDQKRRSNRSRSTKSTATKQQFDRATKNEGFDFSTPSMSRPCHCHDHLAFHLGCKRKACKHKGNDFSNSKMPTMSQPEYSQPLRESFPSSNVRLWASFTTLRHCNLNGYLATCSTWVVGMGNKQLID